MFWFFFFRVRTLHLHVQLQRSRHYGAHCNHTLKKKKKKLFALPRFSTDPVAKINKPKFLIINLALKSGSKYISSLKPLMTKLLKCTKYMFVVLLVYQKISLEMLALKKICQYSHQQTVGVVWQKNSLSIITLRKKKTNKQILADEATAIDLVFFQNFARWFRLPMKNMLSG